jgi:transcriptional regulator with XRE-family HTH domain
MPARTPRAAGGELPEGPRFVADALAENIRAYRLLRRLEQEDVVGLMGLLGHPWRRVTVSEIERGRRNVTVPELVSLTVVLRASIEQLLDTRGPGGKTGPRLAFTVRPGDEALPVVTVDPKHVTGLVCSHKVYVEPDWSPEGLLNSMLYVEGRPDLTDVGPDSEGERVTVERKRPFRRRSGGQKS